MPQHREYCRQNSGGRCSFFRDSSMASKQRWTQCMRATERDDVSFPLLVVIGFEPHEPHNAEREIPRREDTKAGGVAVSFKLVVDSERHQLARIVIRASPEAAS